MSEVIDRIENICQQLQKDKDLGEEAKHALYDELEQLLEKTKEHRRKTTQKKDGGTCFF